MGKSTFMNTSAVTTPIKAPRALHLRFDGGLLSIVFALLLIGFLFVFSSSWQYASYNDMDSAFLVAKQAAFAAAGLALAFVIYLVDYHRFQRLVVLGVILTLAALIMVLVVHDERNGAARSLFGGSFQPSEVAKLVLILYLAFWLNSKQDVLNQLSLGIVPLIGILGVFMGLIMGQPDISTVATIFAIGVMMFFLGGGEWRQIILVMVLAGLLGALLVSIMSTGQARIAQWLAGLQDPKESSQHVLRSIEAIVRGGFFGVGLGRSTTKFTGLPVPWTDSIFAVITEETGMLGALIVIILYGALVWRGLRIAKNAPDLLGRLMAGGVTFWICLEAVINIGQMVNIVPFAGNALPLISAGGSSLVSVLAGIGVLMNVARASQNEPAAGDVPRLGRTAEPGLPADAIALRLPKGVNSAYIRNDSLVLITRAGTH